MPNSESICPILLDQNSNSEFKLFVVREEEVIFCHCVWQGLGVCVKVPTAQKERRRQK